VVFSRGIFRVVIVVRHLAVGDIHGCFTALTSLASFVPFTPDDTLITLGDYVDRGPESFAVLDWLIAYSKRGRLVPLRGNHEIMMVRSRDSEASLSAWLSYGGDQTLASYSHFDDTGRLADVPAEHWDFLENGLQPFFETDTHFFVHANAYPMLPLAEQPDVVLYWESFIDSTPHESGKVMVCGHTAQKTGVPMDIGHAVCIDTWVYGKGWLTCLDVATGQYWQANQKGETRTGHLVRQEL
jgi:serine/threonine protein phosphatase 1